MAGRYQGSHLFDDEFGRGCVEEFGNLTVGFGEPANIDPAKLHPAKIMAML